MADKVLEKLVAEAADRLLSYRREFWSVRADQIIAGDSRLKGKKEDILTAVSNRYQAREAFWRSKQLAVV